MALAYASNSGTAAATKSLSGTGNGSGSDSTMQAVLCSDPFDPTESGGAGGASGEGVLTYTTLARPPSPLPSGHVLIRVRAVALSPLLDGGVRLGCFASDFGGAIKYPLVPGYEISGTIVQVAADVQKEINIATATAAAAAAAAADSKAAASSAPALGWSVGTDVAVLSSLDHPSVYGGGCAEYTIQPAVCCIPKPELIAHSEAAAVLLSGLTAYTALYKQLNVFRGDTVLVVAPALSADCVAVQLAGIIGCRVLIAVSTTEALNLYLDAMTAAVPTAALSLDSSNTNTNAASSAANASTNATATSGGASAADEKSGDSSAAAAAAAAGGVLGAPHVIRVIDLRRESLLQAVMEETGGLGVNAILDFQTRHTLAIPTAAPAAAVSTSDDSKSKSLLNIHRSNPPPSAAALSGLLLNAINNSAAAPSATAAAAPPAADAEVSGATAATAAAAAAVDADDTKHSAASAAASAAAVAIVVPPPPLDSRPAAASDVTVATKSELIACLSVHGRWATANADLQLDPCESRALYLRGGSVSFVFAPSFVLAPNEHGKYLHMMRDLLSRVSRRTIRASIARHYQSCAQIRDAHRQLACTRVGKIVIHINDR